MELDGGGMIMGMGMEIRMGIGWDQNGTGNGDVVQKG